MFGTLHVAFINPVFAAKQIVTADHIGKGRFGLNIVSGWNAGEFDMFGIPLKEHERRYAYTEEWLNIAKRIWTEAKPFDAMGDNFQLKAVEGKPKPFFDDYPLLISAANSPDGRAFAVRHADCLFTTVIRRETLAEEIAVIRATPGAHSEDAGIYGSGHMICRPTRKEAEEYYHYIVYDMGDWEAAEHTAGDPDQGPRHAACDVAEAQGAADQRAWNVPGRRQLRRRGRGLQMDERRGPDRHGDRAGELHRRFPGIARRGAAAHGEAWPARAAPRDGARARDAELEP